MSLLAATMAQIIRAVAPPAGGDEWTPAEISTALWLDATDAATITEVSGAVSQWDDKSGNARHVSQGTASKRPTLSTLNGLSALDFDGADDWLVTATNQTMHAGSWLAFGVAKRDAGATGFGMLFSQHENVSTKTNAQYLRATTTGIETITFNTSNTAFTASAAGDDEAALVYSASCETGALQAFVNGTGGSVVAPTGTISTDVSQVSVGARQSSAGAADTYFKGEIGELILVPDTTSSVTRQRIEGYLAHKWGLEGDLPGGHPYKAAPPTI